MTRAETPGSLLRKAVAENNPLQVVGTVNAYSAIMAEKAGHQAIYLSGGGVAACSMGIPDLGITTLKDVLEDVWRVTAVSSLPLLVDVDTGWGSAFNIARCTREMIRGGAAGMLVEAWLAGQIYVCVSDAVVYEYIDVLSRKLSRTRWERVKLVLGNLLASAHLVTIYYRWRPMSPDPGDDHVIDCAMNAGATVVTANMRHFQTAWDLLGLPVITAVEAVHPMMG